MAPTIECCLANVTADWRQLVREQDIQVRMVPCLEHCDRCREGAFLLVDGTLHAGPSHREIISDVSGEDVPARPIEWTDFEDETDSAGGGSA